MIISNCFHIHERKQFKLNIFLKSKAKLFTHD